jgi:putative oxidoreductase
MIFNLRRFHDRLHPYWSVPANQQMVTQLLFMKNIAVVGGMLILAALGPGPGSLAKQG